MPVCDTTRHTIRTVDLLSKCRESNVNCRAANAMEGTQTPGWDRLRSAPWKPLIWGKWNNLSESHHLLLKERKEDCLFGSPKMRIHTDILQEPAIKQTFKKQYLSLAMKAKNGGLCVSATVYMLSVLLYGLKEPKLNVQLGSTWVSVNWWVGL